MNFEEMNKYHSLFAMAAHIGYNAQANSLFIIMPFGYRI